MLEHDRDELTERECARIIKSAVSPRPIAWISTQSEDGDANLAPYSSYNYISSNHPTVLFNSTIDTSGRQKDTVGNSLETEEFAVNVVTESLLEQMDHTSAQTPPSESEFDLAGVERAECKKIAAPCVAEAAIVMECTLYDSINIYDRQTVIGEVQHFRVSEDILTEGKVDQRKLPTVGRLGGPYYTISEPVSFERQY